MSSEAYNHKASGAAANSSGNTNVGQHHKKGVKFHKKTGYDVEDEAVIIVDDAIRRALNLFYGRKGSSSAARMGASARKQQQQHHHHNAVASRKSSAASSGSSNRLAEHRNNRITTNNFFRDFKSENVYRESILRDVREACQVQVASGSTRSSDPYPEQGGDQKARYHPVCGHPPAP